MSVFVVVDVETANADLSAICQIGMAVFDNGKLIDTFESLVNPCAHFDWFNVSVHGIDEAAVADAQAIDDLAPIIHQYLSKGVVCSYGSFDKTALLRALGDVPSTWLDITKVVRRTWGKFAYKGYGLANMCDHLGIALEHHDALSDAKAAGQVLLEAMRISGLSLDDTIALANGAPPRTKKRTLASAAPHDGAKPNPDGEYFGDTIVFTGTLSIVRAKACAQACVKGFAVSSKVSGKTNYLVKGLSDPIKLCGKDKSQKEMKALELIKQGQEIVFLSEHDFFKMIE